jgi:hypothetical protein
MHVIEYQKGYTDDIYNGKTFSGSPYDDVGPLDMVIAI